MSIVPFHQVEYTPDIVVDTISKSIFPGSRTLLFALSFAGGDKQALKAILMLCKALPSWNNTLLPDLCRVLKPFNDNDLAPHLCLSRFCQQLDQAKIEYFKPTEAMDFSRDVGRSLMKAQGAMHLRRLSLSSITIDPIFNIAFSKMSRIADMEMIECKVSDQFRFPKLLFKLTALGLWVDGNQECFSRALPLSIKSLEIGESSPDTWDLTPFIANLPPRLVELKAHESMYGRCAPPSFPKSLRSLSLVTVEFSSHYLQQLVLALPETLKYLSIEFWGSMREYRDDVDDHLQQTGAALFSRERFPQLRSLALKNCGLSWNDADIAWDLPGNLETLDLSGNFLTMGCLENMFPFFQSGPLQLNLKNNDIDPLGFILADMPENVEISF
jgi:hypothetical protein